MEMSFRQIAEKVFFIICIIATILLTFGCIFQYLQNEDTSVMSFQRYNDKEDNIYPAITVCFGDYLKPDLFENSSDIERYKNFLGGYVWDNQMDQLKYEDVVKNIHDYLLQVTLRTYNIEKNEYLSQVYRTRSSTTMWKPKYYRSLTMSFFAHWFVCWTFEIEYSYRKNVDALTLHFKSSIFKDSLRLSVGNLYMSFGYPGQISASTAQKYMWKPSNYTSFTMEFNIQNVVVLKERKKYQKSCNSNWKKNDDFILQKTIEKVGCKPVFFPVESSLPVCKNASKSLSKLTELRNKIQPCKKMEKVLYSFNEYYNNIDGKQLGADDTGDVFEINVMFQGTTFTQIEQARAYDFQNLVGNAGGYVGLFLGAAISQLPGAVSSLLAYFKKNRIFQATNEVSKT